MFTCITLEMEKLYTVVLYYLFIMVCQYASTNVYNTVWHENLMVIKFYGLSKSLRERKLMDFKFYGIEAT